ncbi:GNAT family N-acetyltransferase [Streptococcus halotolerans]|uniref:GNAT family N-acetyltransferase n=1 Tax=Streptococcus halotolerans TaxID=1814128 RepID=UPI0007872473|nr:GNAT family N-acetyltransferase [Streptococcus halotolerans]
MDIRKISLSDQLAFLDFEDELLEDKRHNPFVEWWPVEDFEDFVMRSDMSDIKQSGQHNPTYTRYFAFVEGAIAGFVICFWEMTHPDCLKLGHIGYIVAPSFRHQGVAQSLIAFALKQYRSLGIDSVLVVAHEKNNPSRRLIEKLGGQLLALEMVNHLGRNLETARYELQGASLKYDE